MNLKLNRYKHNLGKKDIRLFAKEGVKITL